MYRWQSALSNSGVYILGSARIRRFSRRVLKVNLQVIGLIYDAAGVFALGPSPAFDSPHASRLQLFTESAGHFARKFQTEVVSCWAPC